MTTGETYFCIGMFVNKAKLSQKWQIRGLLFVEFCLKVRTLSGFSLEGEDFISRSLYMLDRV